MNLAELSEKIPGSKVIGDSSVTIGRPRYDSRRVSKSDLFCAIKGNVTDGNLFIREAIENGASAVLTAEANVDNDVSKLSVEDDRLAMAQASHALYDDPTSRVKLLGVTATNGKTTCLAQLQSILKAAGHRPGRIGTLGWEFEGNSGELPRTTPEAPDLLELIVEMQRGGVTHVLLEVTSIAVTMKRIAGFRFDGGLFINLTQDHLDLHGSMEAYFQAKKGFFRMLPVKAIAVTNADSPYGLRMTESIEAKTVSYGFEHDWDVRGVVIEATSAGTRLGISGKYGELEVRSPLIGRFNAENLLGVVALALSQEVDAEEIKNGLEGVPQVRGRMERLQLDNGVIAVIDYAHTPDAIGNVLEALRPVTRGRLIIVFGAGGDRDSSKRPVMGEIAAKYADRVIVTSDNPRTEDPGAIIENIIEGAKGTHVQAIEDRSEAIRTALDEAKPGDTVLIAGKGHETYQEINGVHHHFDDREELLKARDK